MSLNYAYLRDNSGASEWRIMLEMKTIVSFYLGFLSFMLEDCRGWTALVIATAASRLDAQLSLVLTHTTAIYCFDPRFTLLLRPYVFHNYDFC